MSEDVQVEVLRRYPRGGTVHEPGAEIFIPPHAVVDATKRDPPHVRVMGPREVPENPIFDATEGAMDMARGVGIDLAPFAGQGSGTDGRIHKTDVERWAKERGLLPAEG